MKKINKTHNFIGIAPKMFIYPLENEILTTFSLTQAFNKFRESIVLNKNEFMFIQFKIKTSDNLYKSISYIQTVRISDFDELLQIFNEFWNLKSSDYHEILVKEVIFSYRRSTGIVHETKLIRPLKSEIENIPSFKYGGFTLPLTMDITKWGNITFYDNYTRAVVTISPIHFKSNDFSKANFSNNINRTIGKNFEYHIQIKDSSMIVDYKLGDKILLSFVDERMDTDRYNLNSFIRTIQNTQYYYSDSKLILKKVIRKCNFMSKIKRHVSRSDNFITMDLETRTIKGVMSPISVAWYDGDIIRSYFLADFSNSNQMLECAIKDLMIRKYAGNRVYLHNFSNFDGVFLLRILSNLSEKIKPIIRDGRIIDLRVSYGKGKKKMNLYFRDSYLLLPSSLESLAINFKVSNQKGIFPYLFINNQKISLNYIGEVPVFKYFTKISKEEYKAYYQSYLIPGTNKTSWDLKKELLKYGEQDVISLYQVIHTFSIYIFKLFRLNIVRFSTLPSLALGIFRSNYLAESQIPLISGQMYNEIKKGYTGGSVDVYKPKGENVYRYDINSLYPFVMKEYPMPVGSPVYFEGDITAIDKDAVGFFDVSVTTPENLKIPILQTKVQTLHGGYRTVAPLGTWRGMHSSIELNEYKKIGYQFKIHRGYIFKTEYIFKEYVDTLYEIKTNSERGTPDFIISKLLLNSLYGRFGMDPHMETHAIVSDEQLEEILLKNKVSDIIYLNNNKSLISFIEANQNDTEFTNLNISVPIAATVTAAARLHMSKFKTMKGVTTFYSDTDSIDIDKPLETKYIGKELGKMKLEHKFEKSVYLAPKVYGGKTSEYEFIKIKGLKNSISFKKLSSLLFKDKKLKIPQDKWYKHISKGEINIKQEVYTLMITDNKRKLVFNENNEFVDTLPLTLQDGKIINN